MDKLKFNSQVCTTIEQSKKLLELGLKPDTADMNHFFINRKWVIQPGYCKLSHITFPQDYIPAWSLHRLIEMCPTIIDNPPRFVAVSSFKTSLILMTDKISDNFNRGKTYDNMIDCIEWLIKEKHFNKEYLNK